MSKEDYLSHALTPEELGVINQSIYTVLEAKTVDDEALRRLVTQRDEFIQSHLATLSANDRKLFAESEIPINNRLQSAVKALFTESLSELSGLVRGLKAVKKYK